MALAAITGMLAGCAEKPVVTPPPIEVDAYGWTPGTGGIAGAGLIFGSVGYDAVPWQSATLVFQRDDEEATIGSIRLDPPTVATRAKWTADGSTLYRPFAVDVHFGMYRFIGYYPDVRAVNPRAPKEKGFVAIEPPVVVKVLPATAAYIGQWTPVPAAGGRPDDLSFKVSGRLARDGEAIGSRLRRGERPVLVHDFVPIIVPRGAPVLRPEHAR
jgi:hypothetical protein